MEFTAEKLKANHSFPYKADTQLRQFMEKDERFITDREEEIDSDQIYEDAKSFVMKGLKKEK